MLTSIKENILFLEAQTKKDKDCLRALSVQLSNSNSKKKEFAFVSVHNQIVRVSVTLK